MSTDVPLHHYTCSVCSPFWHNLHNDLSTHLLGCLYPQKINVSVYPHASLSSNHSDLAVTTTTSIPAHRCISSWPYVFIFILSFRLTAEIYPSTFLLPYMYADAPGYQYNCSVYFFLFGITCTITFPLICWGMYTQIHPKIYLPVYLLCLRTKTYLSPQLLVYLPLNVPVHDLTCLFSYFYSPD